MDKEVVVHIHNGLLLGYKKKKKNPFKSVLMRWMKLEPICRVKKVRKKSINAVY